MESRIKRVLFYSYVLETGMEYWLTLFIGVATGGLAYKLTALAILKVISYFILSFWTVNFCLLVLYKDDIKFGDKSIEKKEEELATLLDSKSLKAKVNLWTAITYIRFKCIITEITTQKYADHFLKVYIFHDFLYSLIIVSAA